MSDITTSSPETSKRSYTSGAEYCVYCGDYYQCRDHVIPVSYSQSSRYYRPGTTVHCCNECNGLLGDRAYFAVESRAGFLLARYKQKREKELAFPHWRTDEIAQLGYTLRVGVEQRMAMKKTYQAKMRNLELCSQGYPVEPIDPLIVKGRVLTGTDIEMEKEMVASRKKAKQEMVARFTAVRKSVSFSVAYNLQNKTFYRVFQHSDGRTESVFNVKAFRAKLGLKVKAFNEQWKQIKRVRALEITKEAHIAKAVEMILSGKAIC